MKQKLFIIFGLVVLVVVLVGLNAVSYTQKEKELDSEAYPNRSTYNYGSTGTRAFFDLLAETGRRPVRWQESPAGLMIDNANRPATLVIIGRTRKEIPEDEALQILRWVSDGGRLVLIDRNPPAELTKTTANWRVFFNTAYEEPNFMTDASDRQQMTTGIRAARPVQPSIYTKGINGVQTSVFATSVNFERMNDEHLRARARREPVPMPTFTTATPRSEPPPPSFSTPPPDEESEFVGLGGESENSNVAESVPDEPPVVVGKPAPRSAAEDIRRAPPLKRIETIAEGDEEYESPALQAPVVHMNADGRNLVVDVPYGAGRIVFLSDPYVVSNAGIGLVDNAQLAVNLVGARGGVIAFDEYHQGYGSNTNRFLEFFAGTPVIPIFLQIVLLVALVFFSQSRRFARAVPEPEPSRLSKLEYVSAMAELQERTKGYDLAIENIYTDYRRRVSRLLGVDAQRTRKQDMALLIVERLPDEDAAALEQLMHRCEDVMHGDATNKREVLRLAARLRELEEKLGLQRRKKGKRANV